MVTRLPRSSVTANRWPAAHGAYSFQRPTSSDMLDIQMQNEIFWSYRAKANWQTIHYVASAASRLKIHISKQNGDFTQIVVTSTTQFTVLSTYIYTHGDNSNLTAIYFYCNEYRKFFICTSNNLTFSRFLVHYFLSLLPFLLLYVLGSSLHSLSLSC